MLDPDLIVTMYEGGSSLSQIANELGCTVSGVRYHLRARGVQMRSRRPPVHPAGPSAPMTISMPEPHLRELERGATAAGMSLSAYIRHRLGLE